MEIIRTFPFWEFSPLKTRQGRVQKCDVLRSRRRQSDEFQTCSSFASTRVLVVMEFALKFNGEKFEILTVFLILITMGNLSTSHHQSQNRSLKFDTNTENFFKDSVDVNQATIFQQINKLLNYIFLIISTFISVNSGSSLYLLICWMIDLGMKKNTFSNLAIWTWEGK